MIIIGYQGIGKSTLANKDVNYIDLESSNFWIDGKRADDWYKPYCKIAEHLSRQGYRVFVSSHECVRNTLKDSNEQVICCVPAVNLKERWIDRLKKRYESDQSDKNYKAYMNAVDRYEDNIREIAASGFPIVTLDSMEYDLDEQISRFDYFDYVGIYDYIQGCKLYPDGTIRDAEGKIAGGVDMDSETWKEIFNGRTEAISFHN